MKQILKLNIRGEVTISRYSHDHVLIDTIHKPNMVVDSGLQFISSRLLSVPEVGEIDKIAVGNGSSPSEAATIDMEASAGELANSAFVHTYEFVSIRYKQVIPPNRILVEAIIPEGIYSGETIAEIGLFSSKTTLGVPSELIARTVLDSQYRFVKQDTEYVSIIWNIIFG